MNLEQLLNYGLGTAMTIILVVFVIRVTDKMVNNQSKMINEQSKTLEKVAGTLLVIQDNIKDLQHGQNALWQEVRNLKRGGREN